MALLSGLTVKAPGTYTFPTTSGVRPASVIPFTSCYMLGFASGDDAPKNVPTRVVSDADFTNIFGESDSLKEVKLFFRNSSGYGNLFFVNTAIAPRYLVTISTVAAGAYTITINGVDFTKTATGSETATALCNDLILLINAHSIIGKEVSATIGTTPGTFLIKSRIPTTDLLVTESNANITIAETSPTTPDVNDYVYAVLNAFDPILQPGFLVAPDPLMKLTNQSNRISLVNAIEILCSDNRFQWMGLVDCGTDITTVPRAIAEAKLYTSVRGHLAYYFPHGVDLADDDVALTPAVAGLAIKRYIEQGFAEPPAGAEYPIKGVKSLKFNGNWNDSNTANGENVNLILNQPNRGIVVWGARTRSADPLFLFVSTRVILNITLATLNRSFDFEIFSAVGGQANILFDIQRKANAVLDTLWRAGLYYGASPSQAYAFVSDATVQLPSLLEQGIVNAFCWVVPATIVERLIITVSRTAIGELEFAVQSDLSAILAQQQAEQQQEQQHTEETTP
jgi:hypothetical protein